MTTAYHELRKIQPEAGRTLVLKVLKSQNGNVTRTAKALGIARKTVRRARDGTLKDLSRKPKNSPNKTATFLENLIVQSAKKTGYRYRRLAFYIFRMFGLRVSENTIKHILKRNQIHKKRIRTANHRRRPLYDYENLAPFAEMQLDTKHILDKNALPTDVYNHILRKKLPIYEWNMIDIATRTRFTAYSNELSAIFGKMFISLVLTWIRAHGIRVHSHIQADNGLEFCLGSKRKESDLNLYLSKFDASFSSIPAGKKYLQGVIERSHRSDDEEFLAIHPIRCQNSSEFIFRAQRWQDTWNVARPHFGIAMDGKTPLDKLIDFGITCPNNLLQFPVFLLEQLLPFSCFLGGEYVFTNYHFFLSFFSVLFSRC